MKKVQLYLPESTVEHLKDEAEQLGISVSEVVRRYLDKLIKRPFKDGEKGTGAR